jgi:hypothetical protein
LADGLIIKDDAGDVVLHAVGRAEQHFAIIAPAILGRNSIDLVEALLDRARAFIRRQDALARRNERVRDIFKPFGHLQHLRDVLEFERRWISAVAGNRPDLAGRNPRKTLHLFGEWIGSGAAPPR